MVNPGLENSMTDQSWTTVDEVQGDLQGEMLKGLLEAQGIPVYLSQEGAGRAYGLGVGALGRVLIMVPSSYEQAARQVLDEYYAGDFEKDSGPSSPSDDFEDEEPYG